MEKGVDYFKTFAKIPPTKGLGFPTKVYNDLKKKDEALQKKEKGKK